MKKSSHILSVIGLGYVGLPLAIELSQEFTVIGYDNNVFRIKSLKNLKDNNFEVSPSKIKKTLYKTFFPTINLSHIRPDLAYHDVNSNMQSVLFDVTMGGPNQKKLAGASIAVSKLAVKLHLQFVPASA